MIEQSNLGKTTFISLNFDISPQFYKIYFVKQNLNRTIHKVWQYYHFVPLAVFSLSTILKVKIPSMAYFLLPRQMLIAVFDRCTAFDLAELPRNVFAVGQAHI